MITLFKAAERLGTDRAEKWQYWENGKLYRTEMFPEQYYIGVSWDVCYEIRKGNTPIGRVYISILLPEGCETKRSIYIEWIKINAAERGKGFLRETISCLKQLYPDMEYIKAEVSDHKLDMYKHIGFEFVGRRFPDLQRDDMNKIRMKIN